MDDTRLNYNVITNAQAVALAKKVQYVYSADGPHNWKQADAEWLATLKKEAKTVTYFLFAATRKHQLFIKPYRNNA